MYFIIRLRNIKPARSLRRTFSQRNSRKKNRSYNKMAAPKVLFTRLEIVFVTISPFTKRTKVVLKVFQEGECCLEGLINCACGLQLQMLPRLNGHFWTFSYGSARNTKTTAPAVSFGAILSCEISDFGQ